MGHPDVVATVPASSIPCRKVEVQPISRDARSHVPNRTVDHGSKVNGRTPDIIFRRTLRNQYVVIAISSGAGVGGKVEFQSVSRDVGINICSCGVDRRPKIHGSTPLIAYCFPASYPYVPTTLPTGSVRAGTEVHLQTVSRKRLKGILG